MRPGRFSNDDISGRPAAEILAQMATALRRDSSFLVAAHINPDGDAIGSELALALAMSRLGKKVVVAHTQPIPARYDEFIPPGAVEVVAEDWVRRSMDRFDWCIVLDTSEPERVGVLSPLIFAPGQKRMAIDHHLQHRSSLFDLHLVLRESASTAGIVLALIDELGVPLDRAIARLLWLGLATDTGWFRFANTTPAELRDAARLLEEGGFETESLFESAYGRHRLERMRLLGDVLVGLRSELGGKFVWGVVSRKDLAARDVELSELEGMIDLLKSIRGSEVAAIVSETGEGGYKISLRSSGRADVDRIARELGGGGHKRAAGCRFQGELGELGPLLSGLVSRELDRPAD